MQTLNFMYTFIVGRSISCTVSTRTYDYDDQFLNEVLQCQKQLTLHIKLIVQHFEITVYRSVICMQELVICMFICMQELVMVKEATSVQILSDASHGVELMDAVFMEL